MQGGKVIKEHCEDMKSKLQSYEGGIMVISTVAKLSRDLFIDEDVMPRHPDKNDDPSAADRFTKINEAYELKAWKEKQENIHIDPEKRNQYDRFGYTAAREQQPHHNGFRHGAGFDPFAQFFNSFNNFGGFGGVSEHE
ncbi:hypothetical protein KUTeg_002476 [Tegillarca granosa]|uniref:J domain-containing protein n=1 Tax=Tegillarca granosa TaxID=220873 RepID=A0ABQ9FUF6_TEGGR|nr:hypothetical protein KUTeg_002476 [Tegillarca granosa]